MPENENRGGRARGGNPEGHETARPRHAFLHIRAPEYRLIKADGFYIEPLYRPPFMDIDLLFMTNDFVYPTGHIPDGVGPRSRQMVRKHEVRVRIDPVAAVSLAHILTVNLGNLSDETLKFYGIPHIPASSGQEGAD